MISKLNGKSPLKGHEPRHQCLIYDGPPSKQLRALAAMFKRKMDEGYRCLYLNSRPMVAGIQSCLASMGVDVESEAAKGRMVLSSQTITSADGNFDVDMMLQSLEDAVDRALNDGYKGLWATGDMTWELGHEKNFSKLMEYEYRLEEVFSRRPQLCGICQYHLDTLPREATRDGLLTHQSLFINETLSRINPHYVPASRSSKRMDINPGLDEIIAGLRQLQSQAL